MPFLTIRKTKMDVVDRIISSTYRSTSVTEYFSHIFVDRLTEEEILALSLAIGPGDIFGLSEIIKKNKCYTQ